MPLYFDVRGLTTRRLHHRNTTSEITVDLVGHALTVRTSDGRNKSFGLGGALTVAGSDARIHAVLSELDVDVHIKEQPFDAPDDHAIPQDLEHGSWHRQAIEQFSRILDWSDSVFEEFSGRQHPPDGL